MNDNSFVDESTEQSQVNPELLRNITRLGAQVITNLSLVDIDPAKLDI